MKRLAVAQFLAVMVAAITLYMSDADVYAVVAFAPFVSFSFFLLITGLAVDELRKGGNNASN